MGFLGGLFWGRRGVKLPLCPKLVRVMLETWNLLRTYTRICSFRKYTFQYQNPLNFADEYFLAKIVHLLKAIVWKLCQRFFSSTCSFCKTKDCYKWKCENYTSCIQTPVPKLIKVSHKLEKWQWRYSFLTSNVFSDLVSFLSGLATD